MHGVKMSSQGIGEECFMHKNVKLMGAGYKILDWFADAVLYAENLLDSAWNPSNYNKISQYTFTAWVH